MQAIHTIVIGAGQAGLAASHHLGRRGIEHVVIERGRLAERWRSQRWDSLTLLTPRWMSRLPDDVPDHTDGSPGDFLTAAEFVAYLERYARDRGAPVEELTEVCSVAPHGDGFEIVTTTETWRASNVVIATGWCDRAVIPPVAADVDHRVHQLASTEYRNPASLPSGGVLVVGASATGVQIADELRSEGREVVLAVGRHRRAPRAYRGRDIFWWQARMGSFDVTIDELPDPHAARHEPSGQLIGRAGYDLDLRRLDADGVELTGRLVAADGARVRFAADLATNMLDADTRLNGLLDGIDRFVARHDLDGHVPAGVRPQPFVHDGPEHVDLLGRGVTTVVWATGFRRSYPWLHAPVLDTDGEIRQHRGATPWTGLYVLGQRFQTRRDSNFIAGVGRDADEVAAHIAARSRRTHIDDRAPALATT